MWIIVPATFQSKCLHLITLPMVMYHITGSLANSGTSRKKPTAVYREEALDFSKPRCSYSYLPPMWYPLGQRQLQPTNHCHHQSLIAYSGVSTTRMMVPLQRLERCSIHLSLLVRGAS